MKIDKDELLGKMKQVETDADQLNEMVDEIVDKFCGEMDEFVDYVGEVLHDTNNPPNDAELDEMILNIPTFLYFVSESQESMGVKEDIAKAVKQEVYDRAYAQASGTVAERTAIANQESQLESLVHTVYQRAYRKIKLRSEMALELLQSAKKIATRRISEIELSKGKQSDKSRAR